MPKPQPRRKQTPAKRVGEISGVSISGRKGGEILIVLGMHRSGTSLLTNILQMFGCDMAHEIAVQNEWNARGYWERYEITDLHDAILKDLDSSWGSLGHIFPLPAGWWRLPRLSARKAEIREFVASKYRERSGLWGFKDPRTSRMLPMWTEICKALGLQPKYVLAVRDPASSIASCVARDKFDESYAQALWLTYNAEAILNTNGKIDAVVDYNDWFTKPDETLATLLTDLGLSVPYSESDAARILRETISDDLRHNIPRAQHRAPAALDSLYQILRSYRDPAAQAAAAKTAVEFDAARDLLWGWSEGGRHLSKTLATTEGRLHDMTLHAGGVAEARDRVTAELAAITAERFAAAERIEAIERDKANLARGLEEALTEGANQAARHSNAIAELTERLAETSEKLTLVTLAADASASELARIDADLIETRAKLHAAEQECSQTHALLTTTREQASALSEQLAQREEKHALLLSHFVENEEHMQHELKRLQLESDVNVADLKVKHETAVAEYARLLTESSDQLAQAMGAADELSAELARANARNSEINGSLEASEEELASIKTLLTIAEQQLSATQAQLAVTDENAAAISGLLTRAKETHSLDASRYVQELSEAQRRAAAAEREAVATASSLAKLEDLLARIEADNVRLQLERDDLALRILESPAALSVTPIATDELSGSIPTITYARTATNVPRARQALRKQAEAPSPHLAANLGVATNFLVCGLQQIAQVDQTFYLSHNPDVADANVDAAAHYWNHGIKEGRVPNPFVASLEPGARAILADLATAMRLFDREFYLKLNPDVREERIDPFQHYCWYGWKEGRRPNAYMSTEVYCSINQDALDIGINPLLHYALAGWRAGCDIGGFFDGSFYLKAYSEAESTSASPLEHFIFTGLAKGFWPSASIDPSVHLSLEEMGLPAMRRARLLAERVGELVDECERISVPLSDQPKISIIVYACNNASSIACCMTALHNAPPLNSFEVILADDGSHDLLFALAPRWQGVRHIRNNATPRWQTALNVAAAESRGEVLVFLDGNAEPAPSAIDALYDRLLQSDADAVSGTLLNSYGAQGTTAEKSTFAPGFAAIRSETFFDLHGFDASLDTTESAVHDFEVRLRGRGKIHLEETAAEATLFASEAPVGTITAELSLLQRLPASHTRLPKLPNPSVLTILSPAGVASISEILGPTPAGKTFNIISLNDAATASRAGQGGGWTVAVNAGLALAQSSLVFFVDADIYPSSGWVEEILATFALNDKVAMVGGLVCDVEGSIIHAGGLVWRDGSLTALGKGSPRDHSEYSFLRPVDQVSPRFFAIRRDVIQSLGDLGGDYAGGDYALADLALVLRKAGYRTVFQPFAAAVTLFETEAIDERSKLQERHAAALCELPAQDSFPGADIREYIGQALVMEQHTPTPDQDAGSVMTVEFMLTLMELGYLPNFVPEQTLEHFGEYTRSLQRIGVRVAYKPFYQNLWEFAKAHEGEMSLLIPFRAPTTEHYLRIVSSLQKTAKVLLHTVDIHHIREEREAALYESNEKYEEAERTKQSEMRAIRASEVTIVVSDYEADYLRGLVPDSIIKVVPLIVRCPGRQAEFDELMDVCFVGGFRHLPNVDAVQYFVEDIWPLVLQQLPGIRFRVMGSHLPDSIAALASETVVIDGFVADLANTLARCRVSVAPLRFGAGIKGKVASSLSFGIPCVATSTAREGTGLGPSDGVVCVDTPAQFADAIVRLYSDRHHWQRLSEGGIEFVERNYSRSATRVKIIDILQALGLPFQPE